MKLFPFGINRVSLLFVLLAGMGSTGVMRAETIEEGFETVTLTDAEGNALTSSWSFGYGLSNGWKIVGGTIYGSAGSANYGLWTNGHESSRSLEASYSSTNSASVFIPAKLDGTVTFWARKTSSSSSTKGTVTIFEANEDGTVTANKLYTNNTLTTTWTQYSLEVEGKYIAINLVRAGLDDFVASTYEETSHDKVLTITDFAADDESVTASMDGSFNATFAVTVENRGTEDLTTADAATVSLLDADKNVVATTEPVVLAAGESTTVELAYSSTAQTDATLSFYAMENLSGRLYAQQAQVQVLVFGPRFGIDTTDGTAHDFGFVLKGAEAKKTFTITNSGNWALSVDVTAPEGFSAEPLTVAAGQTGTLTIALDTATPGMKSGTVTITTNASDVTTMSLAVQGFVADTDKMLVTFDDNLLPEGWEQGACPWTFEDGKASGTYDINARTNSQMLSPTVTVAEGDVLYVLLMATSNFSSEFSIYYSADNGENWTQKKYDNELTSGTYQLLTLGDVPKGRYRLMLEGYKVLVDAVNGFTLYDQTTTAIGSLGTANGHKGEACNLQGQRVGEMRSGHLYIVDGKKIIK